MDATESGSNTVDGYSKLCLSCHDGTVAIDTFDKYAGTLDGSRNLGADLGTAWYNKGYKVGDGPLTAGSAQNMEGTHPISITYDVSDTGLNPVTDPLGGGSGQIDDYLPDGKVQCNSCHDVHDGVDKAVAGTHLLRDGTTAATGINGASSLCLACHDK
jgi:cytochrome c peroxidase